MNIFNTNDFTTNKQVVPQLCYDHVNKTIGFEYFSLIYISVERHKTIFICNIRACQNFQKICR